MPIPEITKKVIPAQKIADIDTTENDKPINIAPKQIPILEIFLKRFNAFEEIFRLKTFFLFLYSIYFVSYLIK